MTADGTSVLIPHKARALSTEALALAINMFRENTRGPYELVIVDGFTNPYEFWNVYSEHARYELMAFFNDDMLPAPDWDVLPRRHPNDRAIVSGYLVEPGVVPVAPQNIRMDFGRSPASFRRSEFEAFVKSSDAPEVANTEGWHMPVFYTKTFFRAMGKYPTERPFPYHSDVDFRNRCLGMGAGMVRLKSFAYHFQGMSNPDHDGKR